MIFKIKIRNTLVNCFGKTTPSHDLETEFIESNDLDGLTEEKLLI